MCEQAVVERINRCLNRIKMILTDAGQAAASSDAELGRVRWRCRRGMRELDQLLTRWLDRRWTPSSDAQRATFLQLLDCEDDRLWRWFLSKENPSDAALAALVDEIRGLSP